jgi:hypothetical protein
MLTYKCSDPEEQKLREAWHRARDYRNVLLSDAEAPLDALQDAERSFALVHRQLSDFLWHRAKADIEEDRRRHPKAKRNQPVPLQHTLVGEGEFTAPTRHLP